MRFMMLMIPRDYAKAPPGAMPDPKAVEKMDEYNKELQKAGAWIGGEGLHPQSMGARITFPGGKSTVTEGPFEEVTEVLGGYWMINAGSKEEAIEWAKKIPGEDGDIIEIRQVQEESEFPTLKARHE